MADKKPVKDFQALKQQYLLHLKLASDELLLFLSQDSFSQENISALKTLAHKLAGNGSTFGFPALSATARQFEAFLATEGSADNPSLLKARLQEFIAAIQHSFSFQSTDVEISLPSNRRLNKKLQHVYLLEDDFELAGLIASELYVEDYHVSLFGSIAEINEAIYKLVPAAVIVDIILPEGPKAGIEWVNSINRNQQQAIPVIFISERGDFETRLQAVRAGAEFYLNKPLNFKQLKQALHECVYKSPYEPYRVLLVDDDEMLASAYRLDLAEHGVNVRVVNNPFAVMQEIEDFKPELILLDLYIPKCSGIELGQVIRQCPEYAAIPIVFLSVESDANTQLETIRLAGDDFLMKPIEPQQLSIHIMARMKRARLITLYQEQLTHALVHQKRHDLLTGLPNRNNLEEEVTRVMELVGSSDDRVAVLFWMDIDNFSHLNDVLGNKFGDQVIVQVANRLSTLVEKNDFLCRVGGDEYALIVDRSRHEMNALDFCGEVMKLFEEPFVIDGESHRITLCIGGSVCSGPQMMAHELIKSADIALYNAKLNGRNSFLLFSDVMEQQLARSLWVERELRHAFNGDQLHLVYQPKYSIDGTQVVGAEVLLRWEHPQAGFISPEEFIPIAEKSTLITDIAYWVLNTSCQQIRNWVQQGLNVPPLAINLSTRDLEDSDFIANLIRAPINYNIERSLLQIELTERTVAKQDVNMVGVLSRLSALGFTIAIDDFGTGYSSLKYLQKMPISLIKIDRSFIEGIPLNRDNCSITDTIIRLAHSMSVEVLAEGVETDSQVAYLKRQGCQYAQGYKYSKPLLGDQFVELINPASFSI